MPRAGRFIPGKEPVPIVQEAGWYPGPVWTGAENNLAEYKEKNTADKHNTANFKIACLITQATSAHFEVKPTAFAIQFI
jgi:hypothetical protein